MDRKGSRAKDLLERFRRGDPTPRDERLKARERGDLKEFWWRENSLTVDSSRDSGGLRSSLDLTSSPAREVDKIRAGGRGDSDDEEGHEGSTPFTLSASAADDAAEEELSQLLRDPALSGETGMPVKAEREPREAPESLFEASDSLDAELAYAGEEPTGLGDLARALEGLVRSASLESSKGVGDESRTENSFLRGVGRGGDDDVGGEGKAEEELAALLATAKDAMRALNAVTEGEEDGGDAGIDLGEDSIDFDIATAGKPPSVSAWKWEGEEDKEVYFDGGVAGKDRGVAGKDRGGGGGREREDGEAEGDKSRSSMDASAKWRRRHEKALEAARVVREGLERTVGVSLRRRMDRADEEGLPNVSLDSYGEETKESKRHNSDTLRETRREVWRTLGEAVDGLSSRLRRRHREPRLERRMGLARRPSHQQVDQSPPSPPRIARERSRALRSSRASRQPEYDHYDSTPTFKESATSYKGSATSLDEQDDDFGARDGVFGRHSDVVEEKEEDEKQVEKSFDAADEKSTEGKGDEASRNKGTTTATETPAEAVDGKDAEASPHAKVDENTDDKEATEKPAEATDEQAIKVDEKSDDKEANTTTTDKPADAADGKDAEAPEPKDEKTDEQEIDTTTAEKPADATDGKDAEAPERKDEKTDEQETDATTTDKPADATDGKDAEAPEPKDEKTEADKEANTTTDKPADATDGKDAEAKGANEEKEDVQVDEKVDDKEDEKEADKEANTTTGKPAEAAGKESDQAAEAPEAEAIENADGEEATDKPTEAPDDKADDEEADTTTTTEKQAEATDNKSDEKDVTTEKSIDGTDGVKAVEAPEGKADEKEEETTTNTTEKLSGTTTKKSTAHNLDDDDGNKDAGFDGDVESATSAVSAVSRADSRSKLRPVSVPDEPELVSRTSGQRVPVSGASTDTSLTELVRQAGTLAAPAAHESLKSADWDILLESPWRESIREPKRREMVDKVKEDGNRLVQLPDGRVGVWRRSGEPKIAPPSSDWLERGSAVARIGPPPDEISYPLMEALPKSVWERPPPADAPQWTELSSRALSQDPKSAIPLLRETYPAAAHPNWHAWQATRTNPPPVERVAAPVPAGSVVLASGEEVNVVELHDGTIAVAPTSNNDLNADHDNATSPNESQPNIDQLRASDAVAPLLASMRNFQARYPTEDFEEEEESVLAEDKNEDENELKPENRAVETDAENEKEKETTDEKVEKDELENAIPDVVSNEEVESKEQEGGMEEDLLRDIRKYVPPAPLPALDVSAGLAPPSRNPHAPVASGATYSEQVSRAYDQAMRDLARAQESSKGDTSSKKRRRKRRHKSGRSVSGSEDEETDSVEAADRNVSVFRPYSEQGMAMWRMFAEREMGEVGRPSDETMARALAAQRQAQQRAVEEAALRAARLAERKPQNMPYSSSARRPPAPPAPSLYRPVDWERMEMVAREKDRRRALEEEEERMRQQEREEENARKQQQERDRKQHPETPVRDRFRPLPTSVSPVRNTTSQTNSRGVRSLEAATRAAESDPVVAEALANTMEQLRRLEALTGGMRAVPSSPRPATPPRLAPTQHHSASGALPPPPSDWSDHGSSSFESEHSQSMSSPHRTPPRHPTSVPRLAISSPTSSHSPTPQNTHRQPSSPRLYTHPSTDFHTQPRYTSTASPSNASSSHPRQSAPSSPSSRVPDLGRTGDPRMFSGGWTSLPAWARGFTPPRHTTNHPQSTPSYTASTSPAGVRVPPPIPSTNLPPPIARSTVDLPPPPPATESTTAQFLRKQMLESRAAREALQNL